MDGLGAGLAALAFWGFVAAIVVAGIWSDIRKREMQHETLRRVLESGTQLDPATMDRLIAMSGGGTNLARDLKVSGLITLFLAPGLAVLAWFISVLEPDAFFPLLGVAALVAFISFGLLIAARLAGGNRSNDTPHSSTRV